MTVSDLELAQLRTFGERAVDIFADRQHSIEVAQRVDPAFWRSKAANGLRAALADAAIDEAAEEIGMKLYPVTGGGRYIATTDGATERHYRLRNVERHRGQPFVLSESERGLQAIGEGPDDQQPMLFEYEFWVAGLEFRNTDWTAFTVAHQIGTVPYGKKHLSIFGDEHILYHIGAETPGTFIPRDDDDPWGDEETDTGDPE